MKKAAVVQCRNLLCKARPFEAYIDDNDQISSLKKIVCPVCGNIGAMYEKNVLSTKEIIRQIDSWSNKVLYRKAFKLINYKKLPATIEQQSVKFKKESKQRIPIVR